MCMPPSSKCGCMCMTCFHTHIHTRQWYRRKLVTVVSVVEGFSGELGTGKRPLYGEKMQTLILLALQMTILGHFELSHASTTIFGLVHLFIFYVFPSNETQETDVHSCFWLLSLEEKEEGCECICMPGCVTVACTISSLGPFLPYPKPLLLWLSFHICSTLQKVCLFCKTKEPNPGNVTEL